MFHTRRCLQHNDAQKYNLTCAQDAKANFALIELLGIIEKDRDHQIVDERAHPPLCCECDEAATWYCKNDDAVFCEAHKVSEHTAKSRVGHSLVPVAQRHTVVLPKCEMHKQKDLDMWCHQCQTLSCYMCASFGTHKEHQKALAPVEDMAAKCRKDIADIVRSAQQLNTSFESEAAALFTLDRGWKARCIAYRFPVYATQC